MAIDPLSDFDTEKVVVVTNGNNYEDIECLWSKKTVLFRADDVLIDFDTKIIRSCPAGDIEYSVVDPGYKPKQIDFIAFYNAEIRRIGSSSVKAANGCAVHGNTFVVNDNARINVASVDKSINIIQQESRLSELKQVLCDEVEDEIQREKLLGFLNIAETSDDCDVKRQAVNDFLATSANIMTIISPFIPAITSLIS